ncbi:MAG: HupE/UreJ family protein [Hyphomicrobiaceae bacterium]
MDGGVGGREGAMMWAAGNSNAWYWKNVWVMGLVAVAAVPLAFGPAVAHKGGTTGYATVSVAGQTVRYALSLLANGSISGDAARDLRDFAAAVTRHVAVEADGAACSGVPAEMRPPSAGRASIEVVVLYACAAPIRHLSIRDGIDAVLGADHHTIADIQWPGGAKQVVFEKEHRLVSIAITGNAAPGRRAAGTFVSYLGLGVEHILLGFDHLLFVVALILPGGRLLSLVAIVTAFTVAHSITLALSVLGLVTLPTQIVEPVIALSIAYVAFENLTMKSVVSRRWAVSFLFGLVHGFGFAGALAEVGLPASGLAAALVGFNLGVEAGQALIIGVLLPLIIWLQRFPWEPRLTKVSSIAIMAVGLVLLAERALVWSM